MALIERLAILIDANSSGATREFRKLSTEANLTDKSLTRSQKAAQGAGVAFRTMGVLAGGVAVAALGRFAQQSLDAASALEEVESKSRVVFGSAFGDVQKFAEETAGAFNLSERAAYQFAGAFGQLFDSAGLNSRQAANFSITLSKLAADLASFNDISVDEAFQKLRSGLSGEAEPLRQVGVFLSAAKVEAEAYASGIAEAGTELTEAQKIQARYNIILRETATAQGDVARTAGSYANAQRGLNAELEDFRANIGSEFSGEAANTTSVLRSFLSVVNEASEGLQGDGGLVGAIGTKLRDALISVAGPVGFTVEYFGQLGDYIDEVTGKTSAAEMAQLEHGESIRFANRAAVDQVSALDEMADSAEGAETSIEDLADAIRDLGGETLDARDAQRKFEESVDDARAALEKNGKTADANGESLRIAGERGRENASALDDIARAGKEASAAVLIQTGSQKRANEVMVTARRRFIDAAVAFGLSRDRAKELAREVGLIPNRKATSYSTPGASSAESAARRVASAVNSIPSYKSVSIGISTGKLGQLNSLLGRASGGSVGPRTYLVGEQGPELVTMRGTGTVMSNAKTRVANASGGGGDTYNITVNTGNPKVAASEVVSRLRARSFLMGV